MDNPNGILFEQKLIGIPAKIVESEFNQTSIKT